MKSQNIKMFPYTDFRTFENDTEHPRVLLNICDAHSYDVTDSNQFYNTFYLKPKKDFNSQTGLKLGDVFYTEIFSYHIICNMVCVKWPKTEINIQPFKLNYFRKCCLKCNDYMSKNNINLIYTPVFGTEILEGNWGQIIQTMCDTFNDSIKMYIFILRGTKF